MKKRPIGFVKALFRYPVKSMLGEHLDEVDVSARGIVGDRAYALREAANGRVVTAKKWPEMLKFRAEYETSPQPDTLAPIKIEFPDGSVIHARDADAAAILSGFIGRAVTLDLPAAGQFARAEIDPASVFGDVPVETVMPGLTAATMPDSFALPAGTFFDSAAIHVLSSTTLRHMHSLIGDDEATLGPRRFRPNILVENEDGASGFVEDEWLEGTLVVGRDVTIVSMRPALRCVMTTHPQPGLARDLRILRAAAQFHHAHVGVFASVATPGTIRVGDEVWLAV